MTLVIAAKNKEWNVLLSSDWLIKEWALIDGDTPKYVLFKHFAVASAWYALIFQLLMSPKIYPKINKLSAETLYDTENVFNQIFIQLKAFYTARSMKEKDWQEIEGAYNVFLICSPTKIREVSHLWEVREHQHYAAIGSGKPYAQWALDYWYSPDMETDQLKNLLYQAIHNTSRRDSTVWLTFYSSLLSDECTKGNNNKLKKTDVCTRDDGPVCFEGDFHWWDIPPSEPKQKWHPPKSWRTYRNVWCPSRR